MPDVALLVELVGNLVAHNAAALVEASEAHDRELSDELRRPQRWLRLFMREGTVELLVESEANPREPSWGTGRFAEKISRTARPS